MDKVLNGEKLSQDESILLVLKAQTNHITHLETTLYAEMKRSREELYTEMKRLREELYAEMKLLREDTNRRFEQMDRRLVFMQWFIGIGFCVYNHRDFAIQFPVTSPAPPLPRYPNVVRQACALPRESRRAGCRRRRGFVQNTCPRPKNNVQGAGTVRTSSNRGLSGYGVGGAWLPLLPQGYLRRAAPRRPPNASVRS